MIAPSAYQIEQVMAVAMAFAARLRDEGMDDESVALALDSETEALTVLERVVRAALDAEALADAAKARLADLAARKARFQKREQDARECARSIMEALGLKKHVAPDFTISLSAGKPKLGDIDEKLLPDSYWKTERTPDRVAIKDALDARAEVPGAYLTNPQTSISVRTK